MKTKIQFVHLALLFCWVSTVMLQAQENPTPLVTAKLEVYPKEIYYGDIFFNRVKVQNNMEKTIFFPIHRLGADSNHGTRVFLKQNDTQVYHWLSHYLLNMLERPAVENEIYWRESNGLTPFHEVAAHTTEYVFLRPLWFPIPEFSDSKAAQELETVVSSSQQQYQVEFSTWYKEMPEMNFTCPITVKPRPKEDYELLLEWYYELPATRYYAMWTEDAVFAHPHYIRESPWQTRVYYRMAKDAKENPDPFQTEINDRILWDAHVQATEKHTPFQDVNDEIALWNAYQEFFKLFLSRTPEALARIDRTNELAAKIIERSKEPDSTFSQNMVEFIQLRGFLVDIRYAKNLEAEETAFVKMMDFVDQSQDKELWVDFIYDVGLGSIGLDGIEGNSRFSYVKIVEYRRRFAERMHITNHCRSFKDYDRIYGFPQK
jgi:hypothetical protein